MCACSHAMYIHRYIDTRIVKDTRIKEESPGTSLLIYDYLIAQPWVEWIEFSMLAGVFNYNYLSIGQNELTATCWWIFIYLNATHFYCRLPAALWHWFKWKSGSLPFRSWPISPHYHFRRGARTHFDNEMSDMHPHTRAQNTQKRELSTEEHRTQNAELRTQNIHKVSSLWQIEIHRWNRFGYRYSTHWF